MAHEIVLHPNSPAAVQFECPACGRECLLTPIFGKEGASLGVRLGHGVQHSMPICRTYRTMRRIDFLVLATSEVPIIRDDVHVSVKLPEAPPLIFSDGGKAPAAESAAEEQARDVAVFRGEASDLARLRDWIVQEEAAERAYTRAGYVLAAIVGFLGLCGGFAFFRWVATGRAPWAVAASIFVAAAVSWLVKLRKRSRSPSQPFGAVQAPNVRSSTSN